jgi:2'-5' RNA ligase
LASISDWFNKIVFGEDFDEAAEPPEPTNLAPFQDEQLAPAPPAPPPAPLVSAQPEPQPMPTAPPEPITTPPEAVTHPGRFIPTPNIVPLDENGNTLPDTLDDNNSFSIRGDRPAPPDSGPYPNQINDQQRFRNPLGDAVRMLGLSQDTGFDPRDADQGPHEQPYPGTVSPLVNSDGSVTTERTITITEPDINGGRATNIPTVWSGRVVSDDEAIQNAANSGRRFPSYDSVDEAVTAAEGRSGDLGAGRATSIGGASGAQQSEQAPASPVRSALESLGLAGAVDAAGEAIADVGGRIGRAARTVAEPFEQPLETATSLLVPDPARPGRFIRQASDALGLDFTPSTRRTIEQERGELQTTVDPNLPVGEALANTQSRTWRQAAASLVDFGAEFMRGHGLAQAADALEAQADSIVAPLYDDPSVMRRRTKDVFDDPVIGIVEGVADSLPSILPTVLAAGLAAGGFLTGNPALTAAGGRVAAAGLATGVMQAFGGTARELRTDVREGKPLADNLAEKFPDYEDTIRSVVGDARMTQPLATAIAAGSGLMEYATEKMFGGIDKKLVNGMGQEVAEQMARELKRRGLIGGGLGVLKEMGQEAVEELVTEAYGIAADVAFTDYKPALVQELRRLGNAGVIGGAAGGLTAGPMAAVEAIGDREARARVGEDIAAPARAVGQLTEATRERGQQAAGMLLSSLVERGVVNRDFLVEHPPTPDRVLALLSMAAEGRPDEQTIEIPGLAPALTKLANDDVDGIAELLSGPITAGEVRTWMESPGRAERAWNATQEIVADLLSGTRNRQRRRRELAADAATVRGLPEALKTAARQVAVGPVTAEEDSIVTPEGRARRTDDPDVQEFVDGVAASMGLPAGFSVFLTGSSEPFAAAGIREGGEQVVILSAGLSDVGLTEDELRAVLGHELAHIGEQAAERVRTGGRVSLVDRVRRAIGRSAPTGGAQLAKIADSQGMFGDQAGDEQRPRFQATEMRRGRWAVVRPDGTVAQFFQGKDAKKNAENRARVENEQARKFKPTAGGTSVAGSGGVQQQRVTEDDLLGGYARQQAEAEAREASRTGAAAERLQQRGPGLFDDVGEADSRAPQEPAASETAATPDTPARTFADTFGGPSTPAEAERDRAAFLKAGEPVPSERAADRPMPQKTGAGVYIPDAEGRGGRSFPRLNEAARSYLGEQQRAWDESEPGFEATRHPAARLSRDLEKIDPIQQAARFGARLSEGITDLRESGFQPSELAKLQVAREALTRGMTNRRFGDDDIRRLARTIVDEADALTDLHTEPRQAAPERRPVQRKPRGSERDAEPTEQAGLTPELREKIERLLGPEEDRRDQGAHFDPPATRAEIMARRREENRANAPAKAQATRQQRKAGAESVPIGEYRRDAQGNVLPSLEQIKVRISQMATYSGANANPEGPDGSAYLTGWRAALAGLPRDTGSTDTYAVLRKAGWDDAQVAISSEQQRQAQASEREQGKAERTRTDPRAIAAKVAKLRTLADRLEETIQNKLNPGSAQQTLTPRRGTIISSMYQDGIGLQKVQRALRGMADAIEAGTLPEALAGVDSRAMVERLLSPYGTYEPAHVLSTRIHYLRDEKGTSREIKAAQKIADRLEARGRQLPENEYRIPLRNQEEIDAVKLLLKKQPSHTRDWTTNLYETERFNRAGITSQEQLDAAKQAIAQYAGEESPAQREARRIRELESTQVGRKNGDFFPTPGDVAARLVFDAEIEPGMDVLEPSAGVGNIAQAIRDQEPGANLTVLEMDGQRRDILRAKGFTVLDDADFLRHQGSYDRIVMNPPFSENADVAHVLHAYKLLRPGGRIVAIMSEHAFFSNDGPSQSFRAFLKDRETEGVPNPAGTFMAPGLLNTTGVNTRTVVIDKPGEAATPVTPDAPPTQPPTNPPVDETPPPPEPEADPPNEGDPALGGVAGRSTFAIGTTDRNRQYPLRWRLVELSDLHASHDPVTLQENPAFDRDLQPRARDANGTREWLAVNTAPSRWAPLGLLTDTHSLDDSAPIVGPDGMVESGNGRVMALQLLARNRPEGYQQYRDLLAEKAAELGFTPEQIAAMARPVAVRENLTRFPDKAARVEFAREANAPKVLEMTAAEKARLEARFWTPADLAGLEIAADGSIESSLTLMANRDIVTRVVDRMPPNERSPMWTPRLNEAGGDLSEAGVTRLRNAIFTSVFGGGYGRRIQQNYLESENPTDANVGRAILDSLADLAKLEGSIASGEAALSLAVAEPIAHALALRQQARANGVTLSDLTASQGLPGMQADPAEALIRDLARFLDDNARHTARLRTLFQEYARTAMREPLDGQATMFGGVGPRPATEVLTDAIREVDRTRPVPGARVRAPGPAAAGAEAAPAPVVDLGRPGVPGEPAAQPQPEPAAGPGGDAVPSGGVGLPAGPGAGPERPDAGGYPVGSGEGAPGAGAPGGVVPEIITYRADVVPHIDPTTVLPGDLLPHLTRDQQVGAALAIQALERATPLPGEQAAPRLLERGERLPALPAGIEATTEDIGGGRRRVTYRKTDGGFLLADGTGVGKSRQMLAVAKVMATRGRGVLIVAPNQVLAPDVNGQPTGSWGNDPATMGIRLRTAMPARNQKDRPKPGEIVITTYERLGRMEIGEGDVVIFDEAHKINGESAVGNLGRELAQKAHSAVFATATPFDVVNKISFLERVGIFEGRPADVALRDLGLRRLDSGKVIVDQQVRGRLVTDPDGKPYRYKPTEEAEARIDELFDRLTAAGQAIKREIGMEGVEVTFDREPLTAEQNSMMRRIADMIYRYMSGFVAERHVISMQRLQQEPVKIPKLVRMAKADLEAGRQVVVFVNSINETTASAIETIPSPYPGGEPTKIRHPIVSHKGTANLLREAFAAEGITGYGEIHGGAEDKDKGGTADRFQRGETNLVVATIASGGTGINLDDRSGTAPRSVYILTPPYDAVNIVQAMGRVWRMTTRSVPTIRVMLTDSDSDNHLMRVLNRKLAVLRAGVQGAVPEVMQQAQGAQPGVGAAPRTARTATDTRVDVRVADGTLKSGDPAFFVTRGNKLKENIEVDQAASGDRTAVIWPGETRRMLVPTRQVFVSRENAQRFMRGEPIVPIPPRAQPVAPAPVQPPVAPVAPVPDTSATPPAEDERPPRQYSSTQFDLPADVAERVLALGRMIRDEDLVYDGRETEPHVTIKYGLESADPNVVREIAETHGPITFTIGKVGVFPDQDGRGFDVVRLDVEGDDLRALNADLSKLPNGDVHPRYQPHITLAYVRPGAGRTYAGRSDLEGTQVTLDAFTFSSRDRTRTTIQLGRPADLPAPATPAAPSTTTPPPGVDYIRWNREIIGRQPETVPGAGIIATMTGDVIKRWERDQVHAGARDDLQEAVNRLMQRGLTPAETGEIKAQILATIDNVLGPATPAANTAAPAPVAAPTPAQQIAQAVQEAAADPNATPDSILGTVVRQVLAGPAQAPAATGGAAPGPVQPPTQPVATAPEPDDGDIQVPETTQPDTSILDRPIDEQDMWGAYFDKFSDLTARARALPAPAPGLRRLWRGDSDSVTRYEQMQSYAPGAHRQWFTRDLGEALFYMQMGIDSDDTTGRLWYVDVPTAVALAAHVDQQDDALRSTSRRDTEFVLPEEWRTQAALVGEYQRPPVEGPLTPEEIDQLLANEESIRENDAFGIGGLTPPADPANRLAPEQVAALRAAEESGDLGAILNALTPPTGDLPQTPEEVDRIVEGTIPEQARQGVPEPTPARRPITRLPRRPVTPDGGATPPAAPVPAPYRVTDADLDRARQVAEDEGDVTIDELRRRYNWTADRARAVRDAWRDEIRALGTMEGYNSPSWYNEPPEDVAPPAPTPAPTPARPSRPPAGAPAAASSPPQQPTPPAAPPAVPPGGAPPAPPAGTPPPPPPGGTPPNPPREVRTVGAGYWVTTRPEAFVDDARAMLDQWAQYSRSGGVSQTEIARLAALMGKDADWLRGVIERAVTRDTREAGVEQQALRDALILAFHRVEDWKDGLDTLLELRARLGPDQARDAELEVLQAGLAAAQAERELVGRAERRNVEAAARLLGQQRYLITTGAGASLVDELDRRSRMLAELGRDLQGVIDGEIDVADLPDILQELITELEQNGALIGGPDSQIMKVLRGIQGALGEQRAEDRPPSKAEQRAITENSQELAGEIAKNKDLNDKRPRKADRRQEAREADERKTLARELVDLDIRIRNMRNGPQARTPAGQATLNELSIDRARAAQELEEAIVRQIEDDVERQGELVADGPDDLDATAEARDLEEKIRDRAARGVESFIRRQMVGPRPADPNQIAQEAARVKEQVVNSLRSEGLLRNVPMTLHEHAIDLVRINQQQAKLRDANQHEAAAELEPERQAILSELYRGLEAAQLAKLQRANPAATQLDAEKALARGPLSKIRREILEQMRYPQRDMERLRGRLDRELNRAFARAEVAEIMQSLRETMERSKRLSRAADVKDELNDIQTAINSLYGAARLRAETLREGLMRANLLHEHKDDQEKYDNLRNAMRKIEDTNNSPEAVGAFLKILREPGWLDYVQEALVINLLTSPMTWGLTGINMISNVGQVAYRAAVEVPLTAGPGETRAMWRGMQEAREDAQAKFTELMDRGYLADDVARAMLTGDWSDVRPELMGQVRGVGRLYTGAGRLPVSIPFWGRNLWPGLYRFSTRPLNAADVFAGHILYTGTVYQLAHQKAVELLKAHKDGYRVDAPWAEDAVVYSAEPDGTGTGDFATRPPAKVTIRDATELGNWILDHLYKPEFKSIKEEAGHIEDYYLFRKPLKGKDDKGGEAVVDRALGGLASLRYAERDASLGRKTTAVAMHTLLTFFLTSYNVTKQSLAFTPLIGTVGQGYMAVTAKTRRQRNQALLKMAIGAILGIVGAGLADDDWLTGDGPDDPAEYAKWRRTHEPHSLWVVNPLSGVGAWRRIDGLILGMPLVATANALEDARAAARRAGRSPDERAWDTTTALLGGFAKGMTAAVLGQSALRGISDVTSYMSGRKQADDYAAQLALRGVLAVSGLRFFAQMGDPLVREPNGILDAFKMVMPGIIPGDTDRESVQPRLNDWGEPIPNQRQGLNSFDPLRSTRTWGLDDPIISELLSYGYSLPAAPPSINNVPLSEAEQRRFVVLAGPRLKDRLSGLVLGGELRDLTPEARQRRLDQAIGPIRKSVAAEIISDIPIEERERRRALQARQPVPSPEGRR